MYQFEIIIPLICYYLKSLDWSYWPVFYLNSNNKIRIQFQTLKMNYGKKSPSMGTPSVYSHVTSRSNANLRSHSRSVKSVKIPWYQKPILTQVIFLDVQRGAVFTGIFALVRTTFNFELYIVYLIWIPFNEGYFFIIFQCLGLFTVATAVFDIWCLSLAAPGSTHYGYYIISYEFVYVGNRHGKFLLYSMAIKTHYCNVTVFFFFFFHF